MPGSLAGVNSIVVRCPNWVGDIVMATPVFSCLRQNFPEASIVACIRGYARGIIEDGPWFDDIIACNDKTFSGFRRTVSEIRRIRPDLAILLPNSIRSLLTSWLGGAKKIYGYRRNLRGLLMDGGPAPVRDGTGRVKALPMQTYYLEICRSLDLKPPGDPRPELFVSAELQARGEDLLRKYGIAPGDRVIGLNPGASFGSSKCWPAEYFAELAGLLKGRLDGKIVLFVGPGEEGIAEAIVRHCRVPVIDTGPDRIDLATLKPLIRRCSLLVTNDTGPRHIAVAFGVPVVVLMGPTDPRYTSANLDRSVVIRKALDCSPCHKKVCPRDHRCMTEIRPAEVLGEAIHLLERADSR